MNIFTRLTTLAIGLASAVGSVWADVPFTPTTITSDGKFAADTKWYTMTIGSSKMRISDNDGAEAITLGGVLTLQDANLWCFVGNETDGFQIYNKQAGATKALTAPTTMSSENGKTSYAILKGLTLENGHTNRWDFVNSHTTLANSWYVNEHGISANALNNRDSKLAFWSTGKDAGSAIIINQAAPTYTVDLTSGSFTSGNSAGTWFSTWASNDSLPRLTLACGVNNMAKNGTNINIASGQSGSCTASLSATTNYIITGYSFKVKNAASSSAAVTITAGGKQYSVTNNEQTITVNGLENTTAQITIAGDNHAIVLTEFTVQASLTTKEPDTNKYLLISTGLPNYRIPAIATAQNGNLIAVADYRFTGSDIGYGRLDLHSRVSKDNGKTWGDLKTVVRGIDYPNTSQLMNTGFGDPCIVADRESNRVLLMSCTGNVMFPSGTREKHQGIARFYSNDNGETWSAPTDIAESIYSQFDNSKIGSAKSMFIGSGRIFQSHTVKVKDYYRLYCSVLFKDINNVNKNYVLYSDDFGESWSVLGGVDVAPIPSGADEPKAEELPDGSVLCSSRISGGRYYNIFHFTNSEKAEGSWGTMATSNSSNNGVVATGNSCNGEVMVLPVRRKADNKDMFLLLQSVPMGSGRTNVGIYYKELASLEDYANADSLAKNWDGSYQVSYMGSAYSTMSLQKDNKLAFLYEESTFGYDYTIVYEAFSIETITGDKYEYKADVPRNPDQTAELEETLDDLKAQIGNVVGNYTTEGFSAVEAALEAYKADPTKANYEAFNAAVNGLKHVGISSEIMYRLRNADRQSGTLYLVANTNELTAATLNESNQAQLFSFIPGTEEGTWKVYNAGNKVYIGQTPAVEEKTPVVSVVASASDYLVESLADGRSSLSCQNPSASAYPALHLAGDNARIVPWFADSPASKWYIEPTDILTDIATVEKEAGAQKVSYYDLQGRRLHKAPAQGVYITSDRKKRIAR